MKKVLSLVAVAGLVAFYACGPSAEEKAKMEKAKQDSIAAAEAAGQAAKAQAAADSAAKAEAEMKAKAAADSAAKAAEAATKGKKGKK